MSHLTLWAKHLFSDHEASYQHYLLRPGDSDVRHRWSGGRMMVAKGNPVAEAQTDLTKVGCYEGKISGVFDKATSEAVRRFQWNISNVDRCLRKNLCGLHKLKPAKTSATGFFDKVTNDALHHWATHHYHTTGTLCAVPITNYTNIVRGTLSAVPHTHATKDQMVVHRGFLDSLAAIDEAAGAADINLKINQAFRVHGAKVSGAVVKPASKSQHLIGAAIDWNIENGGKAILAKNMVYSGLPDNVRYFIDAVKEAGLRWGGDWKKRDPIHFDREIPATGTDYDMLFFFNQRMVQQHHPLDLVPAS